MDSAEWEIVLEVTKLDATRCARALQHSRCEVSAMSSELGDRSVWPRMTNVRPRRLRPYILWSMSGYASLLHRRNRQKSIIPGVLCGSMFLKKCRFFEHVFGPV